MKYDVAVIGGGPAGMMAAGRAGGKGAKVVLVEKNRKLGLKLLITGKGRCNIAHNATNLREFINKFGSNGKFLFSPLSKFSIEDTINFFSKRRVPLKIERGNRIFPKSDSSRDVVRALVGYLMKSKVDIKTGHEVKKIISSLQRIKKIILKDGEKILADNFIICTGGKSYPITGSTGDGYQWLEKLGHSITKLRPALTPLILKERFIKELEGLSLKNVEISLYRNNKKIDSRFGEAIFTSQGISGPIILDLSKKVGMENDKEGDLVLRIDFKPALDFAKLDQRIQRDFKKANNKFFKNSLDALLPQKLIPVVLRLSGINLSKKVNLVTSSERKKILHLLKEFDLQIKGLDDYRKAIITSGGVKLNEIDPLTMKSKIISNLSLAGEILDLDGPTGGYNLQVCWTTGWVAGDRAKAWHKIKNCYTKIISYRKEAKMIMKYPILFLFFTEK